MDQDNRFKGTHKRLLARYGARTESESSILFKSINILFLILLIFQPLYQLEACFFVIKMLVLCHFQSLCTSIDELQLGHLTTESWIETRVA